MALEDICNLRNSCLHQNWLPASPATSFLMTDCYNLGLKGPKKSQRNNEVPLQFFIPPLLNSTSFLNRSPSSYFQGNPPVTVRRPFPLSHGTTTLGFVFQGGVIAAADTRASAGGLVACPEVEKINPIHSHLVVTSSGSGADCMLWERILTREIRLYQLRHKRCLSISGTAKLLSFMLHPFKGTDVCVALTLCGWDKELIYVCSDGARLQGNIFSVGSGSPYAYGVLDRELSWSLSNEEAISLAREAVFRATHRDAYSGNNVDLFHITAQGWHQRKRENLKEEYYRDMKKRGLF
uniref:Proteasome subunit beta n=1 Tax=Sphaeramia orbicularis TaxID=375764 RepID=A0A673AHR7_9TELE